MQDLFDLDNHEPDFAALWELPLDHQRFNHSVTGKVDGEMYQVLQSLVHHPDLPFGGNVGQFLRKCVEHYVDALRPYLEEGQRPVWTTLKRLHQYKDQERMVIGVQDILDQTVENLRHWMRRRNWQAVVTSLDEWKIQVEEMRPQWRLEVAEAWLAHPGMRQVYRSLDERLESESPEHWRQLRDIHQFFVRETEV